MTDFLWAPGHSVALVDLLRVDPQPRSPGVKTTQRTYGLSGAVHEIGPYTEWIWDVFESEDDYQALLAQAGLDIALTAAVTIYTLNQRMSFSRYNAYAVLPEIGADGGWENLFPSGFTIVHRNLVVP